MSSRLPSLTAAALAAAVPVQLDAPLGMALIPTGFDNTVIGIRIRSEQRPRTFVFLLSNSGMYQYL